MPRPELPVSALPHGRLAPSPTGGLHVGHARSFLLAWWSVRARGGRITLRIEDLDAGRVKPGMTEACLADLRWLGLDWDGAPHVQSADTAPLAAAVAELERRGLLYPCVCTRRDLRESLSAPHAPDGAQGAGESAYPGTCRDRFASAAEAEERTGRAPGLRLRVAPGVLALEDALAGPFTSDVAREHGDFLVARRDGAFAYQLAVVVDDARDGVNEVLRGDDLLSSCGRQAVLQEALDLPRPRWIHVPLVVDERGERLAKRSGALTLAALREAGVDPRGLVAWVARSAGQESPDRAHPRDLVAGFDLARLPLRPVRFGPRELEQLRELRVG